ncbi:ferredoxin-type protein NapF [Thauera sinica]|uniref:Ferredoxin-type protein NapF n=1 Tax=Thauera sinica TaxID=2665146 RepID=A0ABW1AN88_9RHOO|nr:ferredoxin-type protein NapF [Thauera sp. K11]ATE62783.1 ferredoxin-type protein NapF [Thauera sp. K11]
MSRRGFLRGRVNAAAATAQRPPWARDEADFVAHCTRCAACIDHCPTQILVRADGGYPAVDFAGGECTFCGECVSRCEPRALYREQAEDPPWTLRVRIGQACLAAQGVECRVCGEACPAAAIRFRPRLGGVALPVLETDACNGCGACSGPCPVRAIELRSMDADAMNAPTEVKQ